LEKTQAPSFWDDAARARRLLADMVYLEEQLEGLERLGRRIEGLHAFARAAARQGGMKGRFEQAHDECVEDLLRLEQLFAGGRPAAFARVEVAARPDGQSALARRDVTVRRHAGEATASHGPSGTSIDVDAEVGDELALELLEAEVTARARRQPEGNGEANGDD